MIIVFKIRVVVEYLVFNDYTIRHLDSVKEVDDLDTQTKEKYKQLYPNANPNEILVNINYVNLDRIQGRPKPIINAPLLQLNP